MTARTDTAARLEAAAAGKTGEFATTLRRAALQLRNSEGPSFPPDVAVALADATLAIGGVTRNEAVAYIVKEWLQANGYLAFEVEA